MIEDTPSPPRAGRRDASSSSFARRQRLDPKLAGIEAAGEVAQQIERLGQNVIARHRLEFGDVERGQDFAQFEHARAARLAAGAGRRHDGVAGIEQHGAALLHIRVDALERRLGGPRGAGHDRPVDQRIEGELVARDVEPDRLSRLERGALREEEREPAKAGLADRVDLAVAGDDIGEFGLERRARRIGARRILGARVRRAASAER